MLRKQSAFVFAIAVAALAPLFCGSTAQAQATRTWVSGVGDDANPCSRTAPCKTFAGAISKTAVNGIINCLDPGGFGTVTITKSITIDCRATLGGLLATGVQAIGIPTAGVVVNLRGLDIEGNVQGTIGINITSSSATVRVEDCKIYGFQGGGATGISFSGGGTLIVSNTHLHSNGNGIVLNGANGVVNMTLRDVISERNGGDGVLITSLGQHAGATIDRTTLAFNDGVGLQLSGPGTVALIGNSTIVGNGTGVSSSGILQSFKNNQIAGNTTDGTPINPFPGPGGTPLQ